MAEAGRRYPEAKESAVDDLFAEALNLEDTYYAEGFTAGSLDGAKAGRIEGRTFGLESALEKFSELGRLGGRASVWDARVRAGGDEIVGLQGGERLRRQVDRLSELTDPDSLSTVNDEESVNAFDDRLREARAKATLVGKMAGEREGAGAVSGRDGRMTSPRTNAKAGGGGGEMEDFVGLPVGKRKA